jgi:oligoendopeptidase F
MSHPSQGDLAAHAKATKAKAGAVTLLSRHQIPTRYQWNPGVLFRSVKAWETEKRRLSADLGGLDAHRTKLGRSAAGLARALKKIDRLRQRLERLSAYASRLYDTDVRSSTAQAMTTAAEQLYTDFGTAAAYVEPELLALEEVTLRRYAADPVLADYDRYLLQLLRDRAHVLGDAEEALLAGASALGNAPYNIYKTFASADMPLPSFVDHQGRSVQLSPAMYARYRQSPHRSERKTVFEKYWGAHRDYRNTFSRMLGGQIAYYDFTAKARKYPDSLASALEPWAIPTAFYSQLIGSVTQHLDAFHRYLRLRKRLLGIEGDQYYYDLYPMPVAKGHKKYTFEQAQKIIPQAMRPLGTRYTKLLRKALAHGSGWLDVYPNQGKRSGAYSSSVYGKHPLVLLNFTDDFDSLSTTAHELGHALHSTLSNEAQPYAKADYSLFNAEVASIFNEALLIEFLLGREKSPDERRFLLSAYLDSFRGTVFRQTLFAEFELEAYQRYAQGKGLTADSLSRLYLKLLRRYHGHSEGVMNVQPLYGIEWSYIPHFYYHYYVYQYVSGFIAATALAQRVLQRGAPAAQQYISKMLEAGCSADPMDILKDAGVNMMTAAPYRMAMRQFVSRTRELEKLSR